MNGLNFTNFKIIKMPVKFTACEGGYIATDGSRMCKVNFDDRIYPNLNNGAEYVFAMRFKL